MVALIFVETFTEWLSFYTIEQNGRFFYPCRDGLFRTSYLFLEVLMIATKHAPIFRWLGVTLVACIALLSVRSASACGGLFCQNTPVNQAAERIIFVDNGDGTLSTLVQINYTGDDIDFSWILPIPTPITAEDVAVPDLADEAFTELHRLTDVQIIAPEAPACTRRDRFDTFSPAMEEMAMEDVSAEQEVEVFASGEVGPYAFDVIGSSDKTALISWLRDNNYRVDPPMEPLIDLYVREDFVFVAMKLLPDRGSDQIAPIQITYESEAPMIPLRLTAVAANPNMGIFTWFFGQSQAVPTNYAHMEVLDGEIEFSDFGGNDYATLVNQRADANDGRAFVTEYAGPSFNSMPNPLNGLVTFNPLLNDLAAQHPYMTRLYTSISPEEMLVDPAFDFVTGLPDQSNVRDLWGMNGLYECEREQFWRYTLSDAIDPTGEDGRGVSATPGRPRNLNVFVTWLATAVPVLGAAFVVTRRREQQ